MSAILSLEVFQERQSQDRFRSRAHEALERVVGSGGDANERARILSADVDGDHRGDVSRALRAHRGLGGSLRRTPPRPFPGPGRGGLPQVQRPAASAPVSLAHGGDAARAGDLGASLFSTALAVTTGSIRWTRPWACRRSASSGTCSRPGSSWGWRCPTGAPPNCWTSSPTRR